MGERVLFAKRDNGSDVSWIEQRKQSTYGSTYLGRRRRRRRRRCRWSEAKRHLSLLPDQYTQTRKRTERHWRRFTEKRSTMKVRRGKCRSPLLLLSVPINNGILPSFSTSLFRQNLLMRMLGTSLCSAINRRGVRFIHSFIPFILTRRQRWGHGHGHGHGGHPSLSSFLYLHCIRFPLRKCKSTETER